MPCKSFVCEFCPTVNNVRTEFRKDALAVHIKAKHKKELALFILDDEKEYSNGILKQYANARTHNPFLSKLYDGASYMFGVKPMFFEDTPKDDGEMCKYIKSEENKEEHHRYIGEVLESISIVEYIKLGKDIIIRSEEMIAKKKLIENLNIENENLKLSIKVINDNNARIRQENKEFRESYDNNTIKDIMEDNRVLKSRNNDLEIKLCNIDDHLDNEKKDFTKRLEEINSARFAELQKEISDNDRLRQEAIKLKEANEKFKIKMKSLVEEEITKYKKNKKKEKKQLEKAKLLAKLNSKSDSDSD
jgi:glycogen debranching enzyme